MLSELPQVADIVRSVFHYSASPLVLRITAFGSEQFHGELWPNNATRFIASKRSNRAGNLLQQGTDLRAVIDILAGQLGGDDLSRVGVHPDMELSPGPTHPCGVLLDQPLTGAAELEPCAVDQQVNRFAARSWS
jgi:hypothetical protein